MIRSNFQFFLLCSCMFGINSQNPEVEIPQGRLRGSIRTNLDNGTYYSFQNIPYAKPPIGELRFKAPQRADSWDGTRDATQGLPFCTQLLSGGQEDCLYLHINTPGLPEENVVRLPVMVWIHGGAFNSGAAAVSVEEPEYLLTKDIILVSINYRLGVFGFLSLDDPDLGVTGNTGMKDQVFALEWIRDNIEYFGGDPNNVSIFGGSAGAMSVQFLVVSPMARGLFHKAFAQSGDAMSDLISPVMRNNGVALAEVLGIQTENWRDMLIALQEAPADDLQAAEASFDLGLYRFFASPIVEIPSNDLNFLPREPIDIIRSGDYNQVPIITGATDAEGLLFQIWSLQNYGQPILIEDFTQFVPDEFGVKGTPLEDLLAIVIRQFYYGDTEPSTDNITMAVNLTTDYAFGFPCYRAAREYTRTAHNPIYVYHFTAITDLNLFQLIYPYPGAGHGDDTQYIFNTVFSHLLNIGEREERYIRTMIDLWTNFAIYGNPTPEGLSDFTWEPVREEQFNYLHLDTEGPIPVLGSAFTEERMEFWWALYEQYSRK